MKTTIKQIVKHWSAEPDFDECGLGVDVAEMIDKGYPRCWRCGTTKRPQRCHIIADSQGGVDEPSNFVICCADCHDEMPMVGNQTIEDVLNWMRISRKKSVQCFRDSPCGMAYNLILSGYPDIGKRSDFWKLRMYQVLKEDYNIDYLVEHNTHLQKFINSFNLSLKDDFETVLDMWQRVNDFFEFKYDAGVHWSQNGGGSNIGVATQALCYSKQFKEMREVADWKDFYEAIPKEES